VLGVVPFVKRLQIDEEDALPCGYRTTQFEAGKVNVAVVLLPRMSNFTDFNLLATEPDIALRYAARPSELAGADVIVLPGSKSTVADLAYLYEAGFRPTLAAHAEAGGELIGICGGYQMLGREIRDPDRIETGGTKAGLSFLDVVTELEPRKLTAQVEAVALNPPLPDTSPVRGYEIHSGRTRRGTASPCFRVIRRTGASAEWAADRGGADLDGACGADELIWGTYIHGVFDSAGFRRSWINRARQRKRLAALPPNVSEQVARQRSAAIDTWANHVEKHLNLESVYAALNGSCSVRTDL
jgi:adenosylcobyric acid synthase